MSEIENEDLLRRGRARKPRRSTDEPAPAGELARTRIDLPPYETIALMLQGGGALGAYQASVYQGLHEAGIQPNWIAGISIGALNTAIIAGNAPEHRVARLVEFWETVCQPAYGFPLPAFVERALFDSADEIRKAFTALQALGAVVEEQKGFFVPRFPPPSPIASSAPQTASYYDTTPLKATLERLCDFDRINSGETRVSVGAVNVASGNFAYFDNTRTAACGAFHRVRRAAAGLRGGRDRWPVLLGRRPHVEHAAL